jgi:2-succinyl-5-enolpyruvyl-6-hydroxy-3-cyclohexene-1-carboxylate synthase
VAVFFRILPGHEETPVFNTYFETSHCLTAQHLARMYGFDYSTASDETSLTQGLKICTIKMKSLSYWKFSPYT